MGVLLVDEERYSTMTATSPDATLPEMLPTHRLTPFDPPPELARYRAEGPIRPLLYPDDHVGWLVTTFDLGKEILGDLRFTSRMDLTHEPVRLPGMDDLTLQPAPPGFFANIDPPEHTKFRRLLSGAFSTRRMKEFAPRITQIVDAQLDVLEAAGSPADLVEHFALPVPSLVIADFLGIPSSDLSYFQHQAELFTGTDTTPEEAGQAFQNIWDYFLALVQKRKATPGPDLISKMVQSGELTDDEITGVAHMFVIAGHDTTANMLSLGTYALLSHPDQLQKLRDSDFALIDNTVEELLRYLTIVHFGKTRTALEDVEIAGEVITRGTSVTISVPAANRDPAKFDNPDVLDITREGAASHLTFGNGIHQCIGQQLSRVEQHIAFPALFRRFPDLRLAATAEQIPMRDNMFIYGAKKLPVAW